MVEDPSSAQAGDASTPPLTDTPSIDAETGSQTPATPASKATGEPTVESVPQAPVKDFGGSEVRQRTTLYSSVTSTEFLIDSSGPQEGSRPRQASAPKAPDAVPGDNRQKRQPDNGESKKEQERKSRIRQLLWVVGVSILFLAASGGLAWYFIWRIPEGSRVFASLLAISLNIIGGGLVTLIFVIPAAASLDNDVKTEFYSVRACYFCVLGGIALAIIASVGWMILAGIGATHVPRP